MRTLEEIQADATKAKNTGDTDALLGFAEELDALEMPAASAEASKTRGNAARLQGNNALALEHYLRALALFEEHRLLHGVADTMNLIGVTQMNMGNYPQALEYYHRALAIQEGLDNSTMIALITGNIGAIHGIMGSYPSALEHYHRALAIHEEHNDKVNVGLATGNIGIIYYDTGNSSLALENFQRAFDIYEEFGYRDAMASLLGNIGNAHVRMGNYALGLENARRSLAMHEELGDRASVAFVTCSIVDTLIVTEQLAEAEALLGNLDSMQIDDPIAMISRERSRASIQEHHGEIDAAVATLLAALDLADQYAIASNQAVLHMRLRDLAAKSNDFALYIKHNNEYQRITEETNGKETTAKLTMQGAERTLAKERTERERERAVLYSTLPKHIADRVIRGETVNDHIDNAAVMFLDIVGFTTLSSTLTSQQVITLLDAVFKICDEACKQNNVTRIKTIGDSYLAVAFPSLVPTSSMFQVPSATGNTSLVPSSSSESLHVASSIANAALKIIKHVKELDFKSLLSLQVPSISSSDSERLQVPSITSSSSESLRVAVRVGLHCGPVTAGVLGTERLQYDVWGDTVNVASRMESTSEPNRIHISEQFKLALSPLSAKERGLGESSRENNEESWLGESSREFELIDRGHVEVKGKGTMQTFWLDRPLSAKERGLGESSLDSESPLP